MARRLQLRRGPEEELPVLILAEPGLVIDGEKVLLYVGTPTGNKLIGSADIALGEDVKAELALKLDESVFREYEEEIDLVLEGMGESIADIESDVMTMKSEIESMDDFMKKILPPGTIVLWSGAVNAIPVTWALCDGQGGTPDLRDRFVVGAGNNYAPKDVGGAETVTLTESQMPSHKHNLSINEAGEHSHEVPLMQAGSNALSRALDLGDTRWEENRETTAGGEHTHTINEDSVGKNAPHENRPPYYALCYIIKLAI